MNWYVIKLIYQVVNHSSTHQFDEQVRMIQADCFEWAVEKSSILGKLGEEFFFDQADKQVHWKFIGVADVIPVESIEDGVELFSDTKEFMEDDNYLNIATARFARLRQSIQVEGVQLLQV